KKSLALSSNLAAYLLSGLTKADAFPTPDVGEFFVNVRGRVWNKTTGYGYNVCPPKIFDSWPLRLGFERNQFIQIFYLVSLRGKNEGCTGTGLGPL
ncbi:MAG: hypothetical protein AAFW68_01270, partial [Pseudomonadota bacterium]